MSAPNHEDYIAVIQGITQLTLKLAKHTQEMMLLGQHAEEQVRDLTRQIDAVLTNSDTESLVIELNEARATNRCWTSWAGQARTFRQDVLALLKTVHADERISAKAVSLIGVFLQRERDGAYDIIQMPGDKDAQHQGRPPRPGDAAPDAVADDGGGERERAHAPSPAGEGLHQRAGVEGGAGEPVQGAGGAGPEADRQDAGERAI